MTPKREADKLPLMIIAMKGHPGTGKSTIARSLSSSLRIPLLDKDDFKDSSPLSFQNNPSISTLLNHMSYEVIYKIASTQLQNGISVILDSPLSSRAHLDRLIQQATSAGARLVVIECRPLDESVWRERLERRGLESASWHKPATWSDLESLLENYGGCTDYEFGDVDKMVVDTSDSSVGIEEIVSRVIDFILSRAGGG